MGHSNWRDVRAQVIRTPEEEARVTEIREAMEVAHRLGELRQHREVTQVNVAAAMATTQGNVSRIEHQEDLFISTLREYVAALGGRLELRAVFPDEVVELATAAQPKSSVAVP